MTEYSRTQWVPVILLKIFHLPFAELGGISLRRAYLAQDGGRLLYADWTLEAAERVEPFIYATGWTTSSMSSAPFQLQGTGAKRIPTGTWVLPYSESLYELYSTAGAVLKRLLHHIDHRPTDPNTITTLIRLTESL